MNSSKSNHNQHQTSRKRFWTILAGCFILFLIGLSLVVKLYVEPTVLEKMEDKAVQAVAPAIELDIGEIEIGYLSSSVSIQNIEAVMSDSSGTEIQTYSSKIKEIQASGIGLMKLLFQGDISINRVNITGADLHFLPELANQLAQNDESSNGERSVIVDHVSINNTSVRLYRSGESEADTIIDDLDLMAINLNLSPGNRPLEKMIEHLNLSVVSISHKTDNGFYELRTDSLSFDLGSGDLTIESAEVQPLLSPAEMPENLGHQTDHFDISSGTISISNFDAGRWFDDRQISISAVRLADLDLRISHDKNFPEKPKEEKPLLNRQFSLLDIETTVDTLIWDGGSIAYREKEEGQDLYGEVLFDSPQIQFLGIQNTDPQKNIVASAKTSFMGEADLNVDFEFTLNESSTQYISGTLDSIGLEIINPVIEPLAFVRLKEDGELTSLEFEMKLDDQMATGELIAIYEDLSIQTLNQETLEKSTGENVLSFFANLIAIRSSNGGEDPRVGEIEFEREKEKSMFSYWWKSLRSGLKSTAQRG